MNKIVLLAAAIFIAAPLFAGTVKEVKGDVDIMTGGKWQKASVGMDVSDSAKIMTGISSSIRIDNKTGHFIVKELSMVTYHEKITDKAIDQKISIDVGKVRVRFAKAKGVQSSFKVQTPKGTASVRGTEEDVGYYPNGGMDLNVLEGSVDLNDNNGNGFTAGEGENGGVGGDGNVYGNSDENQGDSGFGSQFTDDDTSNNQLNDTLNDFFNDFFNEIGEPERL